MARKQLTLEEVYVYILQTLLNQLRRYRPKNTFTRTVTLKEVLDFKDDWCDRFDDNLVQSQHLLENEQYYKFDVLEQLIGLQLITYNNLPANLKKIYNEYR
jgi:hypothetical protein